MFHRRSIRQKPYIQAIVEQNPFSMFVSLISCLIWEGILLGSGSPYALLPMLHSVALLYGFYMEFQRLVPNPVKIKNHFQDQEYSIDGQLIAALINKNNSTPVLEIYSPDPAHIGLSFGYFFGRDYIEMRKTYLSFLFLNAQLVVGPRFQDAVTTINQKTLKRGIDATHKLRELHYFLLKANEEVIEYNLQNPSPLHVPFITMDELFALNHFGDIEKGLVIGCSVAYLAEQKTITRNFDWPSGGDLAKHMLLLVRPTHHSDLNKPPYIFSWTLPFNPGYTATNGHLVLAMNEVEKHSTMRINPKGGIGQFDLFNMILENCTTIAAIHEFIKQHPPASPWILNVASENEGGIFEMLPTLKEDHPPLYRFIPAKSYCIATNHFKDLPKSSAVSCSLTRYEKMQKAVQHSVDPWEIAASSATKDTVHTLIAQWNEKTLTTQSNISNYNSAIAEDPDYKQFRPDEMDIHEYGRTLIDKMNVVKPLVSKDTDQALMDLLSLAYQMEDENISKYMRDIYSELMVERSKHELNNELAPPSISMENITTIANSSKNIISDLMDKNIQLTKKERLLREYQHMIDGIAKANIKLPTSINYFNRLLEVSLFTCSIAAFFNSELAIDLLASGLKCFMNNLAANTTIISACAPLYNSVKYKNNVFTFANSMTKQLKLRKELKSQLPNTNEEIIPPKTPKWH